MNIVANNRHLLVLLHKSHPLHVVGTYLSVFGSGKSTACVDSAGVGGSKCSRTRYDNQVLSWSPLFFRHMTDRYTRAISSTTNELTALQYLNEPELRINRRNHTIHLIKMIPPFRHNCVCYYAMVWLSVRYNMNCLRVGYGFHAGFPCHNLNDCMGSNCNLSHHITVFSLII